MKQKNKSSETLEVRDALEKILQSDKLMISDTLHISGQYVNRLCWRALMYTAAKKYESYKPH